MILYTRNFSGQIVSKPYLHEVQYITLYLRTVGFWGCGLHPSKSTCISGLLLWSQ